MSGLCDYGNKGRRDYDRLSAIRRSYERGKISKGQAVTHLIDRTTVPKSLACGVVKIWDEGIASRKLTDYMWHT